MKIFLAVSIYLLTIVFLDADTLTKFFKSTFSMVIGYLIINMLVV